MGSPLATSPDGHFRYIAAKSIVNADFSEAKRKDRMLKISFSFCFYMYMLIGKLSGLSFELF